MKRLFLILCLFGLPASAAPLVADLSEHQIAIRSTFTGADILLFGSINVPEDTPTDVVVVVRGPDRPMIVRKKNRVGPIWVNTEAVHFERAPGFYAVASNRPLRDIAPDTLLARQEIGLSDVAIIPFKNEMATDTETRAAFRAAIIRNLEKQDLYSEQENAIRFVGPGLFRTTIRLPANVPVGTYRVQAFLLIDGKIEGAHFSPLFIDKSGFERQIYALATEEPFLYGILAVALALFAGWAAGAIFRN